MTLREKQYEALSSAGQAQRFSRAFYNEEMISFLLVTQTTAFEHDLLGDGNLISYVTPETAEEVYGFNEISEEDYEMLVG